MKIKILLFFFLVQFKVQAQPEYIDPILIKPDGTSKKFSYSERSYHPERVATGLFLTFWDSGFTKIRTQVPLIEGQMNGVYKFFNEQGLLIELCTYKNSLEEGFYFYWNNKGELIRKEYFEKGVLKKKLKIK